MRNLTCGFIGLGLIGGSIAKALRAKFPETTIIAYDINESALEQAKSDGVVNIGTSAIDTTFHDCDYIFLCAPVQKNDSNLEAVKSVMSPECILTDVGSVKASIHSNIKQAGLDHCFIGGHPMAGSERVGYANSKATLLENAYYILTPTEKSPAIRLEELRQLAEGMGAIPIIIDSDKHDYITAAISHLPHVVAAALVNLVRDSDSEDGLMKRVAAGGFKDITRIASSSATMWQQICLTNTENISKLLDDYISALTTFKAELDGRDAEALYEEFDSARLYRDSFINTSSGPIKSSYSISVEIPDKSGSLALITMLLAKQDINIKNLGISHNRETEDGALRIEFYDESAREKATAVLRAIDYQVHVL